MYKHYHRLAFSRCPPLFKVKGQMSENTTFRQIKLVSGLHEKIGVILWHQKIDGFDALIPIEH